MGNPPGWVTNTRHTRSHMEVNVMAGLQAGLVTAAEVNAPIGSQGAPGMQIAQWSTIWFVVSILYLVGIYYGMINIRSSAH